MKRSFLEQISNYKTGNDSKALRIDKGDWEDVYEYPEDNKQDEDLSGILYDLEDEDTALLGYLHSYYPDFANSEQLYDAIRQEWLRIRPEINMTPSRYHDEYQINQQLENLHSLCNYNVVVIQKFTKYYTTHIDAEAGWIVPLKGELDRISLELTRLLQELGKLEELSESEEREEREETIETINYDLHTLAERIIDIIKNNQYTLIEPVIGLIREWSNKGSIVLDIPQHLLSDTVVVGGRFDNAGNILINSSGDHTLILSITTHGSHRTDHSYPTFFAIPDNLQICKTTLALPGTTLFSLGEDRRFIRINFGETLYQDQNIQDALENDFITSFTTINDFMRYPILLEINRIVECVNPNLQHPKPELVRDYREWCDGTLNSTKDLMFLTRHNKYIKNKLFSLSKKNSKNITEYGISVLYDSSGLFKTGHQLINVSASFVEGEEEIQDDEEILITLQELLNILYNLGIWIRYGFIDITCEDDNPPVSHSMRNYAGLPCITCRGGGNRLKKKRRYTKRKKYTKKRNYPKNKCTKRKNIPKNNYYVI